MADSTEGDALIHFLGSLAMSLILLIPGLVIHSFIIGVNVNDWWKGRSVTSIDHIVTSLAISRMGTQCSLSMVFFLEKLSQNNLQAHIYHLIFGIACFFLNYSNIWLTSLLLIVFCLKISNIRTRLFLYLRGVIVDRTFHFIIASGLLSAFSTSLPFWMDVTNFTYGGTYNTTMEKLITNDCHLIGVYHFIVAASIPLLFYLISSFVLLFSLYHHTVKMKRSSNLSINLEMYYSAMKFVSFTFIYNIIYFIGLFFCAFYLHFYCVTLTWLQIIFGFLPVLHSSYLIYRTAKLRSQMLKVLQNVTDLLFQRKRTETRENIELVAQ